MEAKSILKWSLVGAALLAAPLSADIVWSGERDVWLAINEFNPGYVLNLDMNEDSTTDFVFEWKMPLTFEFRVIPLLGLDGVPNQTTADIRTPITGSYNYPLSPDVLIGEMLADTTWSGETRGLIAWQAAGFQTIAGGPWAGADHMYMGLQFDAADGVHYGWVEMSTSTTAFEATIHSWAYNIVPGESIMTGAVPEPSSALLVVIGVMSVWVLRRHRRFSNPWKES